MKPPAILNERSLDRLLSVFKNRIFASGHKEKIDLILFAQMNGKVIELKRAYDQVDLEGPIQIDLFNETNRTGDAGTPEPIPMDADVGVGNNE